jgi:tight adherence protein C
MPGALLLGSLAALGLGIVLLVVTVMPGRSRPTGVAAALAMIDRRYGQAPQAKPGAGSSALPGWLAQLARRLSPGGMTDSLQRRLDLAGNPGSWTPDRVLAAKGIGLLVLGGLGALFGLRSPAWFVLCAGLGALIGFFLPDVLLYNSGEKRQAKIQTALPDAMDMLTVCVEAGLGFDAALAQVARNTTGPLAGEFARALQEMQLGASRAQALRAMTARTTVPELRAFVSALTQATELGITVAQVLREQAREMRLKRRQRAEEKAQKVPVKITFPLVFCLFPALFVVILAPGVITISQTLFHR